MASRRSPDARQWWLNWAIVSREHGVVGFIQATVEQNCSDATIAYVIAKPLWANGIGGEAVDVMLDFLCGELGVRGVRATVDRRNVASLRLLERPRFAIVDERDPDNLQLARG